MLSNINFDIINKINGTDFKTVAIKKELSYYGFKFIGKNIIPPQYRIELHNNNDIAEEFLKSLRINEIKEQAIELSGVSENKYTEYYFNHSIRNLLCKNYFYECKTYNTTTAKDLLTFNIFEYKNNVHVTTANNINREYLRTNLIHALLNVYKYNLFHKNTLVPIYEIQKIYQNNQLGELNLTCLSPKEYIIDKVNGSKITYNINGLNGILKSIIQIFNVKGVTIVPTDEIKLFYKNETVKIMYQNKIIGYIGSVKSSILKTFDISDEIYILTINLNNLIANFVPKQLTYQPISTIQTVVKDITFAFDNATPLQPLIDKITNLDYVDDVTFIDKYTSETKISYTVRVKFIAKKDLTKEIINNYVLEIMNLNK
jgi:phenylalanyl-tRNA synthetase beta chain